MKKTLLLAGAACLFSFSANAVEYRPYVGADYIFTHGNIKKDTFVKDDYNSTAANFGVMFDKYASVEAFYQWGFEKTKDFAPYGVKTKSNFDAYGIDVYGYLPIPSCQDKFNLLGSVGLANYDFEVSYKGLPFPVSKEEKSRIGYRAGVGAQYNFTDNVAARVMARYSYLGMNQLDSLQEVTAGLKYTF